MRSDKQNKNSGRYEVAHVEGTIGSYHGLSVEAPTVSSNACTLVQGGINSPTYTGAAAVTATMPAAEVGSKLIFNFTDDPRGGTAILTFDCAGSDVWETGSVVPTSASNKITYDVSAADETSLVFTPTNDSVNLYGMGSTIEFVCENEGKWYINTKLQCDVGVTNGAATGTMLFAS